MDPSNKHKCRKCGQGFKTLTGLNRHDQYGHAKLEPEEKRTCPVCKNIYKDHRAVAIHLVFCKGKPIAATPLTSVPASSSSAKCVRCNNVFKNKHGLAIHMSHCRRSIPTPATEPPTCKEMVRWTGEALETKKRSNFYDVVGTGSNDAEKASKRRALISDDAEKLAEGEKSPISGGKKGPNVLHPIHVSLNDLYTGTTKKIHSSRNLICSKCNGKGSRSGTTCFECKNTGRVEENKVVEVIVEKGMKYGQKITFHGEADEAPDTITGNRVFVLQPEKYLKRRGDDLLYEHTLSLTDALCGFRFVFTHLDGRQLLIKSNPGEVIKHGQFKAIDGEGMPIYPDSLSPEQVKALETALPSKSL